MPFYFTGAGSTSKLQSKPIRWLFLDEVRNYPKGALDTVLKRTRSFRNCKRFTISTPGAENDAVDRAFKAGDQRVWHVHCPKCGHLQRLKFDQLKGVNPDTGVVCKFADVPGARDESGRWDFDALSYYIRYQCANPDCGYLIEDEPVTRRNMAKCGKFVAMNPKAPKHRVSFHWNALLPPWVTWASIVEEFITARAAARGGDLEPLKTFVTETLGEAWKDELGEIDDYGFLESRKGSYKFFETWPEATERWMAADAQIKGGEHYWYAIREMATGDKSRLASYGKCRTLEELEQIRKDFKVPVVNSLIDSAFDSNRIYRFCLATGWKPFRGDDARWWPAKNPRTGREFKRAWRKTRVVVNYGTRARPRPIGLYLWSNDSTKDLLAEAMKGLSGEWTIPSDTPPEYMQQMTAERREVVEDARGRTVAKWKRVRKNNHIFDCECMIRIGKQIQRELAAANKEQRLPASRKQTSQFSTS